MNYKLGIYMAENDTFMFNFDDGRWIEIDFAEYPNYQILSNTLDNDEWYFTVIDNDINNSISDSISDTIGNSIGDNIGDTISDSISDNNDKTIGAVKLFNYRELRQIETNIKSFRKNGILYRKTTQTEFDSFLSKKDDTNDNGKIFRLFDTLYNEPKIEITMV
jgi:hypothetical protein